MAASVPTKASAVPDIMTVPKPASWRMRRDVAGRARHEIADAMRVVEGRRHGQQVREEIVADVSLHPLSRAEHGESGGHPRRAVRRGEEQDDHHVARQRGAALVADGIDRVLDGPRDAERDARGGDQAQRPRRRSGPDTGGDMPRAAARETFAQYRLSPRRRPARTRRRDAAGAPRRRREAWASSRRGARRGARHVPGGPRARSACRASRSW